MYLVFEWIFFLFLRAVNPELPSFFTLFVSRSDVSEVVVGHVEACGSVPIGTRYHLSRFYT